MAAQNDSSTQEYQEYILVWDAPPPVEYDEIHCRSPNFISLLNDNSTSEFYINLKMQREKGSDFDIVNVELFCGAAAVKSIYLLNIENETVMQVNLKDNNKIRSCMLAKSTFVVKLHKECTASSQAIPAIWIEGKTVVRQTSFKSVKSENRIKSFNVMLSNKEYPMEVISNNNNSRSIKVMVIPRLWGIIISGHYRGMATNFLIEKEGSFSYDCIVKNVYTYNYIPFDNMDYANISKISTILHKHTKEEHNYNSHTDLAKVQPVFTTERLSVAHAVFHKLYIDQKLCDITIHSQNFKIRAHKLILASCSSIWRELVVADETLNAIHIADFDTGTIKEMIEFIYIGTVSSDANYEQLLMAADKFDIAGLKERCETLLTEAISMTNVVNLAVLAQQYKTPALMDNVFAFIRKNYAEFKELKEFESLFFAYPELAFKIVKL